MEEVRLPELETIRRFSIAVRSEHAPAEAVAEALRIDLDRIERAMRGRGGAARRPSPARRASDRSTTGKRATGSRKRTTGRSTRRR